MRVRWGRVVEMLPRDLRSRRSSGSSSSSTMNVSVPLEPRFPFLGRAASVSDSDPASDSEP